MTGAELIAAERQRVLDQEDYTSEHDDSHVSGELAQAAIAYAMTAYHTRAGWDPTAANSPPNPWWPWEKQFWKPDTPIRMLVKAGSLIAAEIDRLQRKADRQSQPANKS